MSKYIVTPSIGVNIRSGPGTGYGKVGAYPMGTVVDVLEERDGWGRTNKGWVSLAYLEAVEGPQRVTDTGLAIQTHLIAPGADNRPGGSNPCKYITIHETGNAAKGADAAAHAAYLDSDAGERDLVSWHYSVDDHAIVQNLPDAETAYHAGQCHQHRRRDLRQRGRGLRGGQGQRGRAGEAAHGGARHPHRPRGAAQPLERQGLPQDHPGHPRSLGGVPGPLPG